MLPVMVAEKTEDRGQRTEDRIRAEGREWRTEGRGQRTESSRAASHQRERRERCQVTFNFRFWICDFRLAASDSSRRPLTDFNAEGAEVCAEERREGWISDFIFLILRVTRS